MDRITRYIISLIAALTVSVAALAANAGPEAADETVSAFQSGTEGPQVDIKSMLFGHIGDSYQWHITQIGDKHIIIPLPVIVYSSTGWHCFMSSKLEDGPYKGLYCAEGGKYDGKIVEKDASGNEIRPLDISITKNVAGLMINSLIVVLLILGCSRWYRKHDVLKEAPTGMAAVLEPVITFINDDVIKAAIPGDHSRKYAPYLLTAFFFILVNNLMGIVPVFPGGANTTGNIAVTLTLAVCTFVAVAESADTSDPSDGSSGNLHQAVCADDKAFRQYHGRTRHHPEFRLHSIHHSEDRAGSQRYDVIYHGIIRHIHGSA